MGYDTDTGDSIGKRLINSTDAQLWAHLFEEQFGGGDCPDEATMLTWFANALETGRNAGRKETCPHTYTKLADDLYVCRTCGTVIEDEPTLEEHFKAGFDEARE